MRIQPITMDEPIETFISYKVEHLNEEDNSKSKKAIAFKIKHDDTCEQISSDSEDDDEDMALLTRRFKSFMKKGGNYKGKC